MLRNSRLTNRTNLRLGHTQQHRARRLFPDLRSYLQSQKVSVVRGKAEIPV